MYIAFKWLTGLALAMWVAMCLIDFYTRKYNEEREESLHKGYKMKKIGLIYKNFTAELNIDPETQNNHNEILYEKTIRPVDPVLLQYAMFFAGASAVFILIKKREIASYTKNTIVKIDILVATEHLPKSLKKTAVQLYVAILKYFTIIWVIFKRIATRVKQNNLEIKKNLIMKHNTFKLVMLKKLKDIDEQRRKLGHMLIKAINEKNNIRMQFQLGNNANSKLLTHIEGPLQIKKENLSKFNSFQNLYWVTYQDNIFLKALIKKLMKEKKDVERNLMTIIYEVNKSKNNNLIAFCSRFIVRPNDNVSAEVRKFLKISRYLPETAWNWICTRSNNAGTKSEDQQISASNVSLTEILHNDNSISLDSPKLKGLPGECVWTVKDKDSIIEKLYEYDYEVYFNNGDTIRRIGEYSVYYDKDCLIDFSSSMTTITKVVPLTLSTLYPTRGNFLTGSEAFRKFLQNNKNIVPFSRSRSPPLLYS